MSAPASFSFLVSLATPSSPLAVPALPFPRSLLRLRLAIRRRTWARVSVGRGTAAFLCSRPVFGSSFHLGVCIQV